jgi:hypothetical protein
MNVHLPRGNQDIIETEPMNPEFIMDTLGVLPGFSPDRSQSAMEKTVISNDQDSPHPTEKKSKSNEDTLKKSTSKGQQGGVSIKQLLQKKQPDRKAKPKKFDSQGHLVVQSKIRLPQDVLAPHSQHNNPLLEALRPQLHSLEASSYY